MLEAIALMLEAIASRVEAIAISFPKDLGTKSLERELRDLSCVLAKRELLLVAYF